MVTNINQAYRCSTITLTVSVLLPKDVKVTISVNRDAQTLYNHMNRDAQTFYNYFVSPHNKSTRTKKRISTKKKSGKKEVIKTNLTKH